MEKICKYLLVLVLKVFLLYIVYWCVFEICFLFTCKYNLDLVFFLQ